MMMYFTAFTWKTVAHLYTFYCPQNYSPIKIVKIGPYYHINAWGLHRQNGATAKLTYDLLVTLLRAWGTLGVSSVAWRNQICSD